MDLPEPPAVWPPAPTIAPPQPVKAKSFKLMLPEWARYWSRCGTWFLAVHLVVPAFCEADHVPVPRWGSFPAAMVAWFVVGGLLTLGKYWPRRN